MKKYEELAEECSFDLGIGMSELKLLADAFRWYDEKREKDLKERVMVWLRNEGLITSSRAAEVLETSVSKIIEMSQREKDMCEWRQDEDGIWNTTCHNQFIFTDDGPKENKATFCLYCGRRIVEVEREGK